MIATRALRKLNTEVPHTVQSENNETEIPVSNDPDMSFDKLTKKLTNH